MDLKERSTKQRKERDEKGRVITEDEEECEEIVPSSSSSSSPRSNASRPSLNKMPLEERDGQALKSKKISDQEMKLAYMETLAKLNARLDQKK